jgi:hypothetical protein
MMLCRVEMPFNEQIFGRFYRYRMLRLRGGGRAGVILLPVAAAAVLLLTLAADLSPLLPLAALALAGGWIGYTLYARPNSIFRGRGGAALQTEVTVFTETGFNRSVKSEEGGLPENTSGNYSALTLAVETSRDFYLFTSPAQAYLMDKAYFTKGSPEELRRILRKGMGGKFKGGK